MLLVMVNRHLPSLVVRLLRIIDLEKCSLLSTSGELTTVFSFFGLACLADPESMENVFIVFIGTRVVTELL
jgi:hypothetical protein